MNAPKLIIGVLSGLLLFVSTGKADGVPTELLQIKFNGKCQSTNDVGEPFKETMNNKSILRDYADQNGITNLNSIDLVYAVNADERGDVIAVVDAYTGDILEHIYGLFFSQSIPTKNDGNQFSRFSYLFNEQQSYEMGSAMLTEKFKTNNKGETSHTINGNLQFYLTPNDTNGLKLCTATIDASKVFTPKPAPTPHTNSVSSVQIPQ